MKKAAAIVIVLLSIPFYLFGILFLIASSGQATRLVPGLVMVAIATGLLIGGIRWLRRMADRSPEALRTGAIELARRLGGELTASQFRAEYRISNDLALRTLDGLVAEGNAVREERESRTVYVFTGLKPSLSEKRCPYCGTQLPVRTALRKCPNCGGQLEITKT
ncbi:MAG TPA: zinc ribbon domain-containing protein [Chloroflexi bacterium]|jgi:hypothetical protein|nr:zinc ribbon domain-containing protein [Chloroflexota bacterium]